MQAINKGHRTEERSTDFINTLMSTLTENGRKVTGINFRGSIVTDKYIFGQWIMTVTGNIKTVQDGTPVMIELSNMGTWELYRFGTTIHRNNPDPLGWSRYTLNPCKA